MVPNKIRGGLLLKLGLLLVLIAVGVFVVLNGFQDTARVKKVRRGTAVDAVTGSVTVDADGGTTKELKCEADYGKVIECAKIDVNSTFKEGELLLKLDTSELDRAESEYKRKYLDAKREAHIKLTQGRPELLAHVEKLKDDERAKLYREVSPARQLIAEEYAQAQALHRLNHVSDKDLATAKRALDNFDLQLQLEAFNERRAEDDFKAQLETFRLQREKMEIRAPSDGEITEALIWKGALIGRGHVVGKFMSHARVVTAQISEENFGRVRIGQTALVRLLTHGDREFEAKVSRLVPTADNQQRFTVFLDVKVDRPEQLNPHSTGEVVITVDQQPNSLIMPRRALFDSDKVLVVVDGRVQKRRIEVGYVNLTEVQVKKGLAEGDLVIIDEIDRFFRAEGNRVRIEVIP